MGQRLVSPRGQLLCPAGPAPPGLARDMKTPPEGGALEHRQMGSNWTYRTSLAPPLEDTRRGGASFGAGPGSQPSGRTALLRTLSMGLRGEEIRGHTG